MANEDKRIIELSASESILNDDWIGKDSASEGTTKIQLSLLKQLFGGNNFAGEWHSGTVYNKEAYVTHEGKLYHNIKGGSVVSVNWNSSQWQEIDVSSELKKVVGSLAPTFDTSTNYSVDDLVIYDNTLYRCIAAHTAGTWVGSHFGTVKVSSLLLSLINAIASEASARSNADSTLQSNIDNLSNETIHIDSDGKFFVYVEE